MVIKFPWTETLNDLIERYGTLNEEARYLMLKQWGERRQRHKDTDVNNAVNNAMKLYNGAKEYFEDVLERPLMKKPLGNNEHCFEEFSQYLASAISDDEWMRFARVYLGFSSAELQQFRAKYCQVSREQYEEFLQGIRDSEREWTGVVSSAHAEYQNVVI